MTKTQRTIAALSLAGAVLAAGGMPPARATAAREGANTPGAQFAARMGVAYGVFHHWVLTPYQKGYFATGQPDRGARLGKAATALLSTEADIAAALTIAQGDRALQPIVPLVGGMANGYQALAATFKSGIVNAIGVRGTIGLTLYTEGVQRKLGVPVRETNPVPGSLF